MTPPDFNKKLTELHAAADAALTQFAAPDEDGGADARPWEKKKKSGPGGALAATAAAGAAGAAVHKGVMNNARSAGPVKSVGSAYKAAAGDVANNVREGASSVKHRWQNPTRAVPGVPGARKHLLNDAKPLDKLKSAGAEASATGKQMLRKMVKTVFHYDDPTIKALTELNERADAALTKFGVK